MNYLHFFLFYFVIITGNVIYKVYSREYIEKEIIFPVKNISDVMRPKISIVSYTFIKYPTDFVEVVNYFLENDETINDYIDFINHYKNFGVIEQNEMIEKMMQSDDNHIVNMAMKIKPFNETIEYKICDEFLGNLDFEDFEYVNKQKGVWSSSFFNSVSLRTVLTDLRKTYPFI